MNIYIPKNVETPNLHTASEDIQNEILNYYGREAKEPAGEQRTGGQETQPAVSGASASAGQEEVVQDAVPTQESVQRASLQPIGKGLFGNIYDQFKGKVKEAFDFLLQHKSGDLLGVFHDAELGDIDLVWGSKEDSAGLEHIIDKHVGNGKDFATVDEARQAIERIIANGTKVKDNKDKVIYELDGKRVVVRKNLRNKATGEMVDENKNWVVTSYDNNVPKSEKMSETFTRTTPESSTKAGLSPSTDKPSTLTDANRNETTPISGSRGISDRKGTTNISNSQEKSQKNADSGENILPNQEKSVSLQS